MSTLGCVLAATRIPDRTYGYGGERETSGKVRQANEDKRRIANRRIESETEERKVEDS